MMEPARPHGPPLEARAWTEAPPAAESLLESLGADSAFAEDVLGDLAEEYALRAAGDGVAAARWWYVGEALRSAPHLILNAIRHLSPNGRARLAVWLAGVVLASALVLIALRAGMGPPERLVASTVVVNNLEPVRLPIRVLDASGRTLPDTGVHYAWASGAPVSVSREGHVTCKQPGDAVVSASLGALLTRVPVRCRPVAELRAGRKLELILGGPSREVPFEAVGTDGRPVTLLVGRMHIGDNAIATLEGQRIRARAVGRTWVETFIGNRSTYSMVHVYGPADSPEGIVQGEHRAVTVRLASEESREWRLPAGRYFLRVVLDQDDGPKARLIVSGGSCTVSGGTHLQCSGREDMSVTVRHAQQPSPAPELSGTFLVWRQRDY
jgi:hypothetical protein